MAVPVGVGGSGPGPGATASAAVRLLVTMLYNSTPERSFSRNSSGMVALRKTPGLSQSLQEEFTELYTARTGSLQSFWTQLSQNQKLKAFVPALPCWATFPRMAAVGNRCRRHP